MKIQYIIPVQVLITIPSRNTECKHTDTSPDTQNASTRTQNTSPDTQNTSLDTHSASTGVQAPKYKSRQSNTSPEAQVQAQTPKIAVKTCIFIDCHVFPLCIFICMGAFHQSIVQTTQGLVCCCPPCKMNWLVADPFSVSNMIK